MLAPLKESYDNQDNLLKGRDITLLTKICIVLSSSYVQMWELDHKEDWVWKNWYFWIAVLEKTVESPLDCKEIKLVNSKGNQPWIFIRMIDTEALILWPPDAKSQLIGKDPDAGKVQFSHSVMSHSLRPHGLQHARLLCPSPYTWACSNSCPSSWWCHPTISSSVIPCSSYLQSSQH